jgi:hypothetical protein
MADTVVCAFYLGHLCSGFWTGRDWAHVRNYSLALFVVCVVLVVVALLVKSDEVIKFVKEVGANVIPDVITNVFAPFVKWIYSFGVTGVYLGITGFATVILRQAFCYCSTTQQDDLMRALKNAMSAILRWIRRRKCLVCCVLMVIVLTIVTSSTLRERGREKVGVRKTQQHTMKQRETRTKTTSCDPVE